MEMWVPANTCQHHLAIMHNNHYILYRFQLRCVLDQPLVARTGDSVTGELRLQAHERQSYDVHLTLQVPPVAQGQPPCTSSGVFDLKEPYYRQLTSPGWYNTSATQ